MIKRLFCWVMLVMAAHEAMEAGTLEKVSVRFDLGTLVSLHGRYSESYTLRDMLLPGAGLGLSLRYRVHPAFLIEAGYSYNWMFIKKNMRPAAYTADKPALVLPMYTLNGTVWMSQSESLRPYFTLGGGLCPWRFVEEPMRGKVG